jgi:two-component system, NarL family, invasion response regulator UvrY
MSNIPIQVALADDHLLLRTALAQLINNFSNCRILLQCGTGRQLITAIEAGQVPDVVLLDLNMPDMDGFETAAWLQSQASTVKVLMLTMYDSELTLIRLLQLGVRGFLKKDIHPDELKLAIQTVVQTGYYYSNHSTGKLMGLFKNTPEGVPALQKAMLTDQELQFLKLACSDLTYKEIAMQLGLNPRSVDTLRDQLFVKLDVKSRVGLAMVALRHGVVVG